MNVASVKTGKRGRPAFRRFIGVIVGAPLGGWDFWPSDCDLFGRDSIHLVVPSKSSCRAFSCISRALQLGRHVDALISLSGKSHVGDNGEIYYDFRFIGFPSQMAPRG